MPLLLFLPLAAGGFKTRLCVCFVLLLSGKVVLGFS
jgi:hypothetical protein